MFLGTAIEPDEGAFKAFLQKHGGSSNAFTGMEATGFHFSVDSSQLAPALERFSAFFTCPLLREESTAREMNAVDSEFHRNLQDDSRRLFQLLKSTSSSGHPFRKFSTGNLRTLSDNDLLLSPHAAIRRFYEQHYLAEAMQLCVLGRESLDELEECVLTHFGGLRTSGAAPLVGSAVHQSRLLANGLPHNGARGDCVRDGGVGGNGVGEGVLGEDGVVNQAGSPSLAAHASDGLPSVVDGPLSAAQRGGLLRATPVKEARLLRLMWELPAEATYAPSKVLRYLSSLASCDAEGGLSWMLTQRMQLATSLSCGAMYTMSDATLFGFSITLTPQGLERHEDVVEVVFGYIHKLEAALRDGDGLPTYLFDERASMSRLSYEYAELPEPRSLVTLRSA